MDHVFGVFAVLRDVLGDPEYVPVIPPDKLLEGAHVAAFRGMNKRQLFTYRLRYF